jgi:DNA-binding SARP family transcriptional activator
LSIDCFARRRSVTLLKILVTNYGKVVVKDELIELLWPSDAPKDAAKLLKIAVHYLRRGLGEAQNEKAETSFILTEPNGYAFNPASPHWLDALEFEAMAKEGLRFERQGRWREALIALRAAAEMYGGDYLEDDPYSDWCRRRRSQLRELLFDVLLTTGRLLRAGDQEEAIRCYRRILELDPCLEDVHRDLMDVLCRSGKRTQALRQFEACRRALREEFDAVPVLETETLYRRILGRLTS